MSDKVLVGDFDGALAILDQLERDQGLSPILTYNRLSILQAAGRNDEAEKVKASLVESAWDDASLLQSLALGFEDTGRSRRDLPMAIKAAERASELRGDSDWETLDTVARLHYQRGDLDAAIEWQRKAAQHSPVRSGVHATLEKYVGEKGDLNRSVEIPVDAS
jgi:tetratricopeptide (TPR) repeat protein